MSYSLSKSPVIYDYRIGGEALSRTSRIRDLGVWFEADMKFDFHINLKVNEAYRMMGFIKRTCQQMHNARAIRVLYSAFVRSKLEFSSVVWDPFYDNKINQIEMVQKKFLRYLSFKVYRRDDRYTTYPLLLERHDTIALSTRRSFINLSYLYKVLNNFEENSQFLGQLPFYAPVRSFRQNTLFYLPLARTELYKSSPLYRILNIANTEDVDLFCTSLQKLRTHFGLS